MFLCILFLCERSKDSVVLVGANHPRCILTFGLELRTWNTIRDMMLLLCIAVGLAPAFKMKFWNLGAEGQALVGALTSVLIMIRQFHGVSGGSEQSDSADLSEWISDYQGL